MIKKLAASALAFAFALTLALPASAADREDREMRGGKGPHASQGQVTSTANQANISVSGQDTSSKKLRFHRQQTGSQGLAGIFEKAECSFTCGGWTVTCSGEAVACNSSSCAAAGGGVILTAECVNQS
jgi:hypothetical protein